MAERIDLEADPLLRQEVFTRMRHDEVGAIARNDRMIVRLGNMWIKRNIGNELKRGKYTSQVMRLVATLLRNFWSISCKPDADMLEILTPEHYRKLVHAVLATASADLEDISELKSPSNAVKLGFELVRMVAIKIAESIIKSDNESRKISKTSCLL